MSRLIPAFEQFFSSNGRPLKDGLIDFYEAGSSSIRKTTYADSAETIQNSNPIILNGDGRTPNIFGTGTYRAVLRTESGVQILQRDPVGGDQNLAFGADWSPSQIYGVSDVARDAGDYWMSLTNNNLNNKPSTGDGSNWFKAILGVPADSDDITYDQGDFGSVDRLLRARLQDWVSVKDFGAAGGDVVLDTQAFLSAAATGKSIFIPKVSSKYLINQEIVLASDGQSILGSGAGQSAAEGVHTTGAIFRGKGQYHRFVGFLLTASTARSSAPYASNGFGIRLEADSDSDRMRNCNFSDLVIEQQTGAAIYIVGPVSDGSSIDRCRLFNNEGHAIAIDRGTLGGATRSILPTGVLNINNVNAFGNTGHAVAIGHPSDTTTTPSVRVAINNLDANVSSMVLAQLYDATNEHGLWISGTGQQVNNSTISGSGSQYGAFVRGTNNDFNNFRQVDTAATLEIGDNVAALPTNNIRIDGINVVNATAQSNAVIVSGTSVGNVSIRTAVESDITSLIDTKDIPGLKIEYPTQQMFKSADQAVNNSTSLVDVSDLKYYLGANERVNFTAVVFHSGSATADMRLSVGGPAGATDVKFGAHNNIKVGASNAVDVDGVNTSFGDLIIYGSTTTERMAAIEGYIENGATEGVFVLRFAQLSAEVSDTKIHKGSYLKVTSAR